MSETSNEDAYFQGRQDMESKLLPKIEGLKKDNKYLHEQVAFLESREVCTMPHDDIEAYGCPYCYIENLNVNGK